MGVAMSKTSPLLGAVMVAALLTGAMPARAGESAPAGTEKVKLQWTKGKGLLQPGFSLAEYSGLSKVRGSSTKALGVYASAKSSAEINVTTASFGDVTIQCKGGESRTGLGWITFDHDKLAYVCTFQGAGAGPSAAFTLVQAKGGLIARLQSPQRAGELQFGEVTLRTETRQVGSMPVGLGTGAIGYVIRNGDQEVAAVDLTGLSKTAYLPPKGAPERDAAAVMALILMLFMDAPV